MKPDSRVGAETRERRRTGIVDAARPAIGRPRDARRRAIDKKRELDIDDVVDEGHVAEMPVVEHQSPIRTIEVVRALNNGDDRRIAGGVGTLESWIRRIVKQRACHTVHGEDFVPCTCAPRVDQHGSGALFEAAESDARTSRNRWIDEQRLIDIRHRHRQRRGPGAFGCIENADAIAERRQRRIRQPGAEASGKDRGNVVGERTGQPRDRSSYNAGSGLCQILPDPLDRNAKALMEVGRLGLRSGQSLASCSDLRECPQRGNEDRQRDQHFDEREPGPIASHSRRRHCAHLVLTLASSASVPDAPAPCTRSRLIFSNGGDEYVQDERAIGIFGQRRHRPPSHEHSSRRRGRCRCRPIDRTRRGSRRTEAYSSQACLPATAANRGRQADGRAGSDRCRDRTAAAPAHRDRSARMSTPAIATRPSWRQQESRPSCAGGRGSSPRSPWR